jgi:putative Holliday junction resolvase
MLRARIVGVDFGRARVGIALSDPLSKFAQPVGAFSPNQALEEIEKIRTRDGIATIVLGWPLELDGSEGESTQAVAAYQKRLEKTFPGLDIVRWDERLSSREAKRVIAASGLRKSRRREKSNVDAVAAAIILQSFLDQ